MSSILASFSADNRTSFCQYCRETKDRTDPLTAVFTESKKSYFVTFNQVAFNFMSASPAGGRVGFDDDEVFDNFAVACTHAHKTSVRLV